MTEAPESFDNASRLIRRAGGGDREAMSQIMHRYQGRLLDRVRQMMGPLPRQFAESQDFLQDLFIDIVQSYQRYDICDEEDFLRWATRIARNNIRDQVRRQRLRAMETLASSILVRREPGGAAEPTPPEAAAMQDDVARLDAALDQLPEDYRRVIELRDLQQLSYREVAQAMNRPGEDAAQMLHARALSRLTQKLGPRSSGGP